MFNRLHIAATLLASLALFPVAPAIAIDGEILITHAKALAGNVTPGDPAGYPVIISIPGSFKLASNLFVTANKIGIQVTSTNVTIDLNGFTMQGSSVAWYGIVSGAFSVAVRNGYITRFKYDGINGTSSDWTVEDVGVTANGRDGIVIGGSHARVQNSNVSSNLGNGINVGATALVQSNIVAGNSGIGVVTGVSSVIQGNTVSNNGQYGIYTIRSTVVGNAINNNGSWGLEGGGTSGYSGNTLYSNGGGAGGNAIGVLPANPNACTACP